MTILISQDFAQITVHNIMDRPMGNIILKRNQSHLSQPEEVLLPGRSSNEVILQSGPLFTKKTPSCQYRDSHYKPETVSGLSWGSLCQQDGVFLVNRGPGSPDHLRFILGIIIPVRQCLFSEQMPWATYDVSLILHAVKRKSQSSVYITLVSLYPLSGLNLCLRPARERLCYFVMTSVIGWAQT